MKKIVKTTLVRGCFYTFPQRGNCPFWHSLPNGNWYCTRSDKIIATFPSPMSNVMPYAYVIPDWCELEEADNANT